ncbi:MAG TPA: nucleotidyltransferase family protein [Chthoniobacter sp.]|nr:nucleotidyltransferase family protein [Chthoniobacter sp.]
MEKTGAVILAAGGSSRLGTPKQFLEYGGKTLVARAAEAATGCSPVVVVTGRETVRVEKELADYDVTLVRNIQWERGIGSSIRLGVLYALQIAPDLDSLIILVCDQLQVTSELVKLLREVREAERKPMVACHYAGSPGVPALFARSLFPRLQDLPDESGAKGILTEAPDDVSMIAFPEGTQDIDTPADVQAHLERTHGG